MEYVADARARRANVARYPRVPCHAVWQEGQPLRARDARSGRAVTRLGRDRRGASAVASTGSRRHRVPARCPLAQILRRHVVPIATPPPRADVTAQFLFEQTRLVRRASQGVGERNPVRSIYVQGSSVDRPTKRTQRLDRPTGANDFGAPQQRPRERSLSGIRSATRST